MSQPVEQADARDNRPSPPPRRTIEIVPRGEFLREFGSGYQPGEHVTFIGPTRRGKTRLSHEMLGKVISPKHKAVILAGKPPKRDGVMGAAAERLNLRVVDQWPPDWNYRDRNRNGYVLRPQQSMKDIPADNENLKHHFQRAMIDNYGSDTPVITVVDEAHHVQNKLKLREEYEAPLMRGAPVNAEWSLMQRGAYMSLFAYDSAEHLIIFYDPDDRNVRRYSEMIGGVDPRHVSAIVANLKRYRVKTREGEGTISEALYIRRGTDEMYVIDVA